MNHVIGIYLLSLLIRAIAASDYDADENQPASHLASSNLPRIRHLSSSIFERLSSPNTSLAFVIFTDSTIDLHDLGLSSIEWTTFVNYHVPVSTMILSSNHLSSLPTDLLKPFAKSLIHLNLQQNRFQSLTDNHFLRSLEHLRTLDLSKNRLDEIFLQDFLGLKRLDTLILRENRITYLSYGVFTYCRRVTTLDLSDNRISMIDSNAFRVLKNLKVLLLSNNPLGQRSLTNLLMKPLTNLRHLDLENTQVETLPPFLFVANERLQSIKLRRNRFPRTPTRNSTSGLHRTFCGARSLTDIDLVSTNTHSLDICTYYQLSSLRRLYLMDNPLDCTCDLFYLKYGDVYRLLQNNEIEVEEQQSNVDSYLRRWVSRPELRHHLEKAHERGDLYRFPVELSSFARCATPKKWSEHELDNVTGIFRQCRVQWSSIEEKCRNHCQISDEKEIPSTTVQSASSAMLSYRVALYTTVTLHVFLS